MATKEGFGGGCFSEEDKILLSTVLKTPAHLTFHPSDISLPLPPSSSLIPLSVMLMILPFGAHDIPIPLRGSWLAEIEFEAAELFPH